MLRKLISLALCMILCVSAAVIPACAEETAPVEKRITISELPYQMNWLTYVNYIRF